MDTGINNRVALLCGASRGIGLACAQVLAQEGARVILVARSKEALSREVGIIRDSGGTAAYLVADLSITEGLSSLAEQAESIFGQVDILVNNSGGPPAGENLSFSSEAWLAAFKQTFLSAEVLTRVLLHPMVKQNWGRIINLTSVSVRQPVEGLILSNSLRLALVGWAKTLSKEMAQYGVTINNIATGLTKTRRMEDLAQNRAEQTGTTAEEALKAMAASIPIKRLAQAEEIAWTVAFLASERATYITGVTLPVDGGYILGV